MDEALTRIVLIEDGILETRVAVKEAGRTVELHVFRPDEAVAPGAIFLGRVARIEPGLDAAFVEIGVGPSGLLAARDARTLAAGGKASAKARIGALVTEGQAVLVRVRREAVDDKGPRLVALAETAPGDIDERRALERRAKERGGPGLVRAAPGPVAWALERLGGDEAGRLIVDTPELLAQARAGATSRVDRDGLIMHKGPAGIFEDHGVEADIESALADAVVLPGGGELRIEETAALTAIDVNSARFTAGREVAETALATNLAAAAEIPRQLRLRAIGGKVVIDFVDLRRGARRVGEALTAGLADDPVKSELSFAAGLAVVVRERRRRSLAARLYEPCPLCGARHRRPTAMTAAATGFRRALRQGPMLPPGALALRAAPEVARLIAGAPLAALERRVGRAITLIAEEERPRAATEISPA